MTASHLFAVCAYGESPYLEEAVRSIADQTLVTGAIVATSTPNPAIESVCSKYGLELFVNDRPPGIGTDWNFALDSANADLVTLCHQDDFFDPRYAERVLARMKGDSIIAFTDYYEEKDGVLVKGGLNLSIKRLMLSPFLVPGVSGSIAVRRMILSMGSPICCPSVTYNKRAVGGLRFSADLRCDLDWDFWERSSRLKGGFVYVPEPLMTHRIHTGSETTRLIGENVRGREDLAMFRRFWPDWAASLIYGLYSFSQRSNASKPGKGAGK